MNEHLQKFERLKLLLDQAGINYLADPDKAVCAVRVRELRNCDFNTVYIALQGNGEDIIVATLTVLDGEKNYHYPKDVLEHCMKFNKKYGLLKAQYDERYGDIDLSYEAWLATLPENFAIGLHLLITHGEELAAELKNIIRHNASGNSVETYDAQTKNLA